MHVIRTAQADFSGYLGLCNTRSPSNHPSNSSSWFRMVKLGSNLANKLDKEQSMDDGFDNIPLITPLEVNQLQQPFTDKIIVKTTAQYQPQPKKNNKLYVPGMKKLHLNMHNDVSEKVKLTGLILITLGFLACLLLLVMYKALWYDQLTCPEGFLLKHKHCTPAVALDPWYYTETQQRQDPGRAQRTGSLYAALGSLNQAKRSSSVVTDLPPSPCLPVTGSLKQEEEVKEEAGPSNE
ncbi:hypothetical protein DPEC_G00174140 [Dallia pectoralis]|uniref:Uncharacterized protein n=1 Tax=Dallia pectoralis TaxID=75939 RepID=A0ACC2GE74_DALPE|nr:hypothetical protein DPEC_G00174140 [Dallia pectoralis]